MTNKEQRVITTQDADTNAHQQGPTLLPSHIARAVSLATRSTGLAVRLGSRLSSYGLDAARLTTLSSLELTRGIVEGVLGRAGRDTLIRSQSDLAVADAESVLERSLDALHYTVTQAVFWTSASFQLSGVTLAAASEVSQVVLSSLDQLFGSTDSSRAIASIITLVRRELYNPATGERGEGAGVVDLVQALSTLAYLQKACRRSEAEERRRAAYEEVIWDVVVLNDGQRIDVHEESLSGVHKGHYQNVVDAADQLSGDGPSRPGTSHSMSVQPAEDDIALSRLKHQIAASLPSGTSISISNSVSTVQTIIVDVDSPDNVSLPTLPGAQMVETSLRPSPGAMSDRPTYRVVYKIERNKFRTTSFRPEGSAMDLDGETVEALPVVEANQDMPMPDAPAGVADASVTADQEHVDLPSEPASPPVDESRMAIDGDRREMVKSPIASPSETTFEHAANQKKARLPLSKATSRDDLQKSRRESMSGKKTTLRKKESSLFKGADKKTGFKQALKGSGQSLSNIWNKDAPVAEASTPASKSKPQWKSPGSGRRPLPAAKNKATLPRAAQQPDPRAPPGSRLQTPEPGPRSSSRLSYVSMQDGRGGRRSSHDGSLRPGSPIIIRTSAGQGDDTEHLFRPSSPVRRHRRVGSHAPSIYSLGTNDSQTSLVLSSYYQKSAYSTADALSALRREGFVGGSFPTGNLLRNITRYMRFSSAAYGSHFLKVLGISKEMPALRPGDVTHQDVRHFIHHTESDMNNILLASFVDPQGGTDSTGSTGTGVPLVHYISLDHEAKAVVLACRGTLGFEDVLADMTCEYDTLIWRGRSFRVHKGVHASARRLLYGGDGRVLLTLKEALLEFPDYGIVMCGHSLGGAVTALLGVMLSEPNPSGKGFVTSPDAHIKQLTDGRTMGHVPAEICLPSRRPIHVYAYGSPGCMSRSLCSLTKGLITSVVHGNDIVPHLSLGSLHDIQAVAQSFKSSNSPAKTQMRQRIWGAFSEGLSDAWYGAPQRTAGQEEEDWMLPALESLRATMTSDKLMPPGEVFVVESTRVLRRDAFLLFDEEHIGRPARRIVLKYIKDVETRFGEIRFGASMLLDHSPAKYEDALNKLRLGVSA